MKRFALATMLGTLIVAGCDKPTNPPPPAPDKPAADVDVKADKDGTAVKAPGVDVEVNKK